MICMGPYIFIIAKPFPCSTKPSHKVDEKLEGAIFCLLKSGSDVTQIQRQLNRDNFNVTRMTITNVRNGHEKERKNTVLNMKKNTCLIEDIPRLLDVVKKIRTMILKANKATKCEIVNKLGLSIRTINNVIKHTIK